MEKTYWTYVIKAQGGFLHEGSKILNDAYTPLCLSLKGLISANLYWPVVFYVKRCVILQINFFHPDILENFQQRISPFQVSIQFFFFYWSNPFIISYVKLTKMVAKGYSLKTFTGTRCRNSSHWLVEEPSGSVFEKN